MVITLIITDVNLFLIYKFTFYLFIICFIYELLYSHNCPETKS